MRTIDALLKLSVLGLAAALAACGGDSSDDPESPDNPSEAQRAAAAAATAENNPVCLDALGAFYWEIGDAGGVRASGSVGSSAPSDSTSMKVYSASKWMYAASVAEKHDGLTDEDVPYMNFTSGYGEFGNLPVCIGDLVENCHEGADERNPDFVGRFIYDSGHMQRHAIAVMGMGDFDNDALAADLSDALGIEGLGYNVPQLAAGVVATPAMYGRFLRKLLSGDLELGAWLGRDKVCANERTAGCDAVESPVDDVPDEAMNYSMGHWVEDDPATGDGSFSSPGGGGFYPWIDKDKTLYGLIAREHPEPNAGIHSAQCGRLVRQAWRLGAEVTDTEPTPP